MLDGQVLNEGTARCHRREMRCRRDREPRFPKVGNNGFAAVCRQADDAMRFRETAHAADIRLHHAHSAPVHQFQELETRGKPLTGGNRNRLLPGELCVAVQIVRW